MAGWSEKAGDGCVSHDPSEKNNLILQAPTGTGKTLSTVYPAVKAVGEGLAERIFYATAKTITRTVAEEAFSSCAGMDFV